MTALDRVPPRPPAPLPRSLRRLRLASIVLLLLSAICVATIDVIARISIYAVAPVPIVFVAAVAVTALFWIRKHRADVEALRPQRQRIDLTRRVDSDQGGLSAFSARLPRFWWWPR